MTELELELLLVLTLFGLALTGAADALGPPLTAAALLLPLRRP